MSFDLILVDGPNLFNSVVRRLEDQTWPSADHRAYLMEWFDVARFLGATLGAHVKSTLGSVILHSRKPLGRGLMRLDPQDAMSFWGRQAAAPNTSCLEVDIPGEQQETYPFDCASCGHKNEARSRAEKGMDTSMTVYLFESMERWDEVCLFTRDVDFAPVVWALRRRGKGVFVAGEPGDRTTALGRASQSFFALNLDFLVRDRSVFEILRAGGALDQLAAHVAQHPGAELGIELRPSELSVRICAPAHSRTALHGFMQQLITPFAAHLSGISTKEADDHSSWFVMQDLREFGSHFDCIAAEWQKHIRPTGAMSVPS